MSTNRTVFLFGAGASRDELLDEKRTASLPVDKLKGNLQDFMASLHEILPAAGETAAGMSLKTVTVAVGIDGKGKVGFLGTGAEVGGSATLTLAFER